MDTKLKLLYIRDYLEKNSDEDNPVSALELMNMLESKGITCERKSIYSDIAVLKDYGLDILRVKAPKNGYVLVSRDFELAEIRLLIDAVQAANFITPKKTQGLIEKIGNLCSDSQFNTLKNQVYIENKVKCRNEEIYYNIDLINRAIVAGKRISFRYRRRVVGDSLNNKTTERTFTVSPYAMLWSDDHYYLVCNNPKYDNLMHVRLDRMRKVSVLDEDSRSFTEVSEYKRRFDTADYAERLFNMFSGEMSEIELRCSDSILEEILDRFGEKVPLRRCDSGEGFCIRTNAVISDGLVSWIMQFGQQMQVVAPEELKQAVLDKAREIIKLYK